MQGEGTETVDALTVIVRYSINQVAFFELPDCAADCEGRAVEFLGEHTTAQRPGLLTAAV